MPSITKTGGLLTEFSEENDEEKYTSEGEVGDGESSIERKPFLDVDAYSSVENHPHTSSKNNFKISIGSAGGAPYATGFKSTNMSGFVSRKNHHKNNHNIDIDLAGIEDDSSKKSRTKKQQESRNMIGTQLTSKQSNSVLINPAELKGVKIQTPFSPTTYTRLVDIHNKAKKFEESFGKNRSRAQI